MNFNGRWSVHRFDLRKNKHHSQYLQRAWNKYGEQSFMFWILEDVDDEFKLIEREQRWMDEFSPEYNICRVAGSCLGMKHSPEARAKMSAANLGKKITPEQRVKISTSLLGKPSAMKGKKHTPETRAKISIGNLGRKHSFEARAKISAAMKRYKILHQNIDVV